MTDKLRWDPDMIVYCVIFLRSLHSTTSHSKAMLSNHIFPNSSKKFRFPFCFECIQQNLSTLKELDELQM